MHEAGGCHPALGHAQSSTSGGGIGGSRDGLARTQRPRNLGRASHAPPLGEDLHPEPGQRLGGGRRRVAGCIRLRRAQAACRAWSAHRLQFPAVCGSIAICVPTTTYVVRFLIREARCVGSVGKRYACVVVLGRLICRTLCFCPSAGVFSGWDRCCNIVVAAAADRASLLLTDRTRPLPDHRPFAKARCLVAGPLESSERSGSGTKPRQSDESLSPGCVAFDSKRAWTNGRTWRRTARRK